MTTYGTRRLRGCVVAALSLLATSCGTSPVEVSGRVLYNEAPLNKPGGKIVFVGPNGEQVPADIGPDGRYSTVKAPRGLNRIAVYYPNPDAQSGKTFPVKPEPGQPPVKLPPSEPKPTFLTPLHYASPETSELSVNVEKKMVFDVNLIGPTIP